jgi:microcompartment protein CcmL/EutN
MSQAIGMIETKGVVGLMAAGDAMAKAAEVTLVKSIAIGGSYVTAVVKGDVGNVRAALEAGAEAVKQNGGTLVCAHMIPNPHSGLSAFID